MQTDNKIEMNKSEDEFDKIVNKQIIRFNNDIDKHLPDSLDSNLLLLKGHLLIEYYLGILLILSDENQSMLSRSFSEKISKCKEKDLLDKNITDSIISLNKLRNKMAHELEYVISESDIDYVAMIFGKEYVMEKMENIDINTAEVTKKLLKWFLKKNLRNILIATIVKINQEKQKLSKSK